MDGRERTDAEVSEKSKDVVVSEEEEKENLWLLQNRISKTFNVITQYGEENFYISFSGGKDSTVLSALVDMAVPGNQIPRVFANTGIEYKMILEFVREMSKYDDRIVMISPTVPIKPMLKKDGYPFKSKKHSEFVAVYQKHKTLEGRDGLLHYLGMHPDGKTWSSQHSCPNILKYQFSNEWDSSLKISDKCCKRLKVEPLHQWEKENNKPYSIIGLMREEGGRRSGAQCMAFKGGKFKNFQPLVNVSKKWEEWFIDKYEIKICDIYKPPYNFPRTGCKGCPFITNLEYELNILDEYFPAERKQCEAIWKPVYDEYRRIGYRLKPMKQEVKDEPN